MCFHFGILALKHLEPSKIIKTIVRECFRLDLDFYFQRWSNVCFKQIILVMLVIDVHKHVLKIDIALSEGTNMVEQIVMNENIKPVNVYKLEFIEPPYPAQS